MLKPFPETCLRCGSEKIIPRAKLLIPITHYYSGILVELPGIQGYQFREGDLKASTHARVCGECGFIELYADGAPGLYQAYEQSLQKRGKQV